MKKEEGKRNDNKNNKQKKGEKTMKTKNTKRRQRAKKMEEKNEYKKAIKEEEATIKVLTHELLASTLLSNANSLLIPQSFKPLFMNSSHVKFDLPLPLLPLVVRLITPL
jgi:hypothetical protein